jgi:hypothetical protein
MKLPRAAEITAFHDYALAAPGQPARFESGLWEAIETDHWHNGILWEQEALARRRYAPDSEVASNKRAIDANDRKRREAIGRIDKALLDSLRTLKKHPEAKQHSETPGAIIDRLSILAINIHHMRLRAGRAGADPRHVETCRAKQDELSAERDDLAACLDRLLAEAQRGEVYFKLYPRSELHDDPGAGGAR